MNSANQNTVFDPMFVRRVCRQTAPGYTRRPTVYLRGGRQPAASPSSGPARAVAVQPVRAVPPGDPAPGATSEPLLRHRAREVRVKRFDLSDLRPRRIARLLRVTGWRGSAMLYGMAAIVFLAGLGVSLNGLRANRAVAAQVAHLQQQTEAAANSLTGNATTNTVAAPSAAKPSSAAVTSYAVSPSLPRYIDIPALGIHARVLSEGVSSKNQLQVPWNIYDTGWYNASAQPGQAGAMLIDGHSGIDGLHGVFYKLGSLTAGDQITVTRGDGQKFTYTVIKVQVADVGNVNMQSMVVSADADAPGLNLITCTGDQIPGTDQLNERVQVYAVMR